MSRENVEVVRRLIGVFRSRTPTEAAEFSDQDMASVAEALDPEIEWDATQVPVEDIRGMYHGHLGVAEFWQTWLEAWETVEIDDDPQLIDAGDHVFLWIEHQKMRGRGSGIEVNFPPWGNVLTFREGRITRVVFYLDKHQAVQAAGLSE